MQMRACQILHNSPQSLIRHSAMNGASFVPLESLVVTRCSDDLKPGTSRAGTDPDFRLWLAIRPAHCPARPGTKRLLPDRAPRPARPPRGGAGAARTDLLGRPRERLRARRPE